MKSTKIIISGIVQGVFFRKFIRENASRLGLKGYVKNILNNKVEALFQGNKDKTEKIIELCKKGPLGACVEHIELHDIEDRKHNSFEVIYLLH